ncbi:type II secretion system protein J, partial [Patescibacteria group bacterium]
MYNIKNKQKGSVLVYVLVGVSISSILFAGLAQYIVSQINYAERVTTKEEALNVADAGVEFYRWYLSHQTEGMQIQEVIDFWEDTDPYPYAVDVPYESDYRGIGKFSITATVPEEGSTITTIESTGWTYDQPDVQKTIQARLRLASWSEYVILANSDIYIEDGEDVDGKVHSNGGVRCDGVAHNVVSSAVTDYYDSVTSSTKDGVWTSWASEYNSNMSSNVFLLGKRFPVPEKDFDTVVTSFSQIFEAAQELNLDFSPATKAHQIILKGDVIDVNRVLNEKKGVVTKTQSVYTDFPLPDVGAIYVNKNIWVEGYLGEGKRLVIAANNPSVSHGNIYISDDITYSDYSDGTVLGLIAKNNIEVVENSNNNLRIDAALLAQIGYVGRADYGDNKSSITVYGAIATNQGYGFSGYSTKNIIFDNSLIYIPPPYFPIEGIY